MVLMVYRVQFISHLRGRSLLNLAGTQPSMLFRYCLPAPNQLKHKTLSIPKEATVFQLLFMCVWGISIHASAKETTHLGYAIGFSYKFQSTPPRRRRPQHIVIPQLSCAYLVVTTFLSAIFSFISQYVVLFFLF